MTIKLSGEIMSNEWADIWRYFGWTDNCCPRDLEEAFAAAGDEEVDIEINSPGGDLFCGKEMLALIQSRKKRTRCIVTSMAASAATVAMMGADEIVAKPYATICIHNPSTYCEGEAKDMRKTARELDTHRDSIIAAYLLHSKRSPEDLKAKMDKDEWMTAEEALEYGIVDSVEVQEAEQDGYGRFAAARVLRGEPSAKMVEQYNAAKKTADNDFELERERLTLLRLR